MDTAVRGLGRASDRRERASARPSRSRAGAGPPTRSASTRPPFGRCQSCGRDNRSGVKFCADCGAKLHIVMCVKPAPSKEVGVGTDKIIVDWVSEAESFLQNLVRELPHDQITTHVGVGDPAKTMCEEATRLEAKMIVVGNRRVQGMSRVLGSIAADVARHAPCDVLIANTTIA